MKKTILLTLQLLFLMQISIAQKEGNIWYFGNYAGLDFNSVPPIGVSGALFSADNASTVCDTGGNLLFYTNGEDVWNKNHQIMVNGGGLMGSNDAGQSVVIIRQPQSSFYYVFTVAYACCPDGLRYSIVDMSLQGGLGEVVQKNTLLYTPTTEKLAGTYDCKNNRFWLITHECNSDQFKCYKIDSSGLDTNPVTSIIGSTNSGGTCGNLNNSCGQMSLSRDAKKLACALYISGKVELFDFDINTGIISNIDTIDNYPSAWGIEFSPDGTKLYLSQWTRDSITQFDMNAGNISAVINSATTVGHATVSGGPYYAGFLQLGPDNKIYIAKWNEHYLAAINDPDSTGAGCNFADSAVYLGFTTYCKAGLSRVVYTCPYSLVPIVNLQSSDTNWCDKKCINFNDLSTNNPTSWQWYFPGAQPDTSTAQNPVNICYNNYGAFNVKLVACNSNGCDSINFTNFISEYQLPQAPVISQNGDTLTSSTAYSYAWYNLAFPGVLLGTNQIYIATQPGSYYVLISDSIGCQVPSAVAVVQGINDFILDKTQFSVNPNPNNGIFYVEMNGDLSHKVQLKVYNNMGQVIYQTTSQNSPSIKVDLSDKSEGIYLIEVVKNGRSLTGKIIIAPH